MCGATAGDALLTSVHVAKQVNICDKHKSTLTLHSKVPDDAHGAGSGPPVPASGPYWVSRTPEGEEDSVAFSLDKIPELAAKFDLLTTEAELLAVAGLSGGEASPLWKHAGAFKVYNDKPSRSLFAPHFES